MSTPEAQLLGGQHDTINIPSPSDAPSSGEIIKLVDNRVAIVTGLNLSTVTTGDKIAVVVSGPVRVAKALATDLSSANDPYWDISANAAVASGSAGTGDPALGMKIAGGTTSDTFIDVDLNAPAGTAAS